MALLPLALTGCLDEGRREVTVDVEVAATLGGEVTVEVTTAELRLGRLVAFDDDGDVTASLPIVGAVDLLGPVTLGTARAYDGTLTRAGFQLVRDPALVLVGDAEPSGATVPFDLTLVGPYAVTLPVDVSVDDPPPEALVLTVALGALFDALPWAASSGPVTTDDPAVRDALEAALTDPATWSLTARDAPDPP